MGEAEDISVVVVIASPISSTDLATAARLALTHLELWERKRSRLPAKQTRTSK